MCYNFSQNNINWVLSSEYHNMDVIQYIHFLKMEHSVKQ